MSVDVLLMNGKWFDVAGADYATVKQSGVLVTHQANGDSVRLFGIGSWVTWDEKGGAE